MKTLRLREVLSQAGWLMVELGFVLLTVRLACCHRAKLFPKATGCKKLLSGTSACPWAQGFPVTWLKRVATSNCHRGWAELPPRPSTTLGATPWPIGSPLAKNETWWPWRGKKFKVRGHWSPLRPSPGLWLTSGSETRPLGPLSILRCVSSLASRIKSLSYLVIKPFLGFYATINNKIIMIIKIICWALSICHVLAEHFTHVNIVNPMRSLLVYRWRLGWAMGLSSLAITWVGQRGGAFTPRQPSSREHNHFFMLPPSVV